MASELELKYPYIRIIGFETKFPNKMIVHAVERTSLYAVALQGNKYAILDEYNKVLDVLAQSEFDSWDESKSIRPIVVDITGLASTLSEADFKVGYVANVKRVSGVLGNLASGLYKYYEKDYNIKARVQSITLNIAYQSSVKLVMIADGMDMTINNCHTDLVDKLAVGLAVFNKQHIDEGLTTGHIVVNGTATGQYYYEA